MNSFAPRSALLMSSLIAATAAAQSRPETALTYPASQRGPVIESYHGVDIADPYRWLENPDAPETREWIKAQNELTFGYLANLANRANIGDRLNTVWNYPKFSAPIKARNRYFTLENSGLLNQPVLYVRQEIDGEPAVVLDMNSASTDGTVALTLLEPSPDGNLV